MWAEAAKWLGKFENSAVLTAFDDGGYPFSIRVASGVYDSATGRLPVAIPDALRAVDGPAGLICHYHDEKMWNIKAIQIKGRLETTNGASMFVTTSFDPPKFAMLRFISNGRTAAQKYLAKRGLARPSVNWAAIKEVQRRASRG